MVHTRRDAHREAAIIIVGTELVSGLRTDTNGAEIARSLATAGFHTASREVLPDDVPLLSARMRDRMAEYDLVVVGGGLGPTHDDVTREAAARALGVKLERDPAIVALLEPVAARHHFARSASQVMRQADVLAGARVLVSRSGTAPGQLVSTTRGHLLLLPGPPHELRPLLAEALAGIGGEPSAAPRVLRCVGIAESDAQVTAENLIATRPGVGLTVLAQPALVDIVLFDEGAGSAGLDRVARDIADALGDVCYTTDGATLAEVVISAASRDGLALALAESCTGGMIAAELTSVPGASSAFLGSAVTYADDLKHALLGVDDDTLNDYGAVSNAAASEMASGIRALSGADITLAVTGIAGPGGGSPDKPVGTVWFAVDAGRGVSSTERHFSGDRDTVRARATATALDLLRRAILSSAVGRP